MKTSYFANYKNIDQNKYIGVSIALYTPKTFRYHCLHFAPSKSTLEKYKNGEINQAQYTKEYLQKLNYLYNHGLMAYPLKLIKSIENQENKEAVLLCYEAKDKFCHRHILVNFLKEKFNIIISEI